MYSIMYWHLYTPKWDRMSRQGTILFYCLCCHWLNESRLGVLPFLNVYSTPKLELLFYQAPVSVFQAASPFLFYLTFSFAIFLSIKISFSPSHPSVFAQPLLSSLTLSLTLYYLFSLHWPWPRSPNVFFFSFVESLCFLQHFYFCSWEVSLSFLYLAFFPVSLFRAL